MIEIRNAYAGDVPLLVEMGRETFEVTFAKDNTPENMKEYLDKAFNRKKIEAEILNADYQYFLAYVEGTAAGYAKMKVGDEVNNQLRESSIELERIYVVPSFQGKKIGVALMQKCIRYAEENRFHWLWLGVWERNSKAINFYKAWGFEKFGQHIFQMGDDPQTDWLMKKLIGPSKA